VLNSYGWTDGGCFAEYACAGQDHFAPKPAALSLEQAAAVPVSGFAALQGLRDVGEVQPGQKVLVLGASGGVGSFAVQLAKAFGAEVTGVCSTAKVDLVRSIGAGHIVDYTPRGRHRRDALLGPHPGHRSHRSLSQLRRALTPRGTLVIVGSEGRGRWMGGFDRNLRAVALSRVVGQRLGMLSSKPRREDLQVLRELIDAGKVTPLKDRTFPLREAPEAIRYLVEGHGGSGKIVITV
jgi:NADPH:quinone reductase-like Zn-dependent oxidoreductase